MAILFKGLITIIAHINKQISNVTFDSLQGNKSNNSSTVSRNIGSQFYSNSKSKEQEAIKSDFDSIGKDLYKSVKQYEKSKFKVM